jgi:hypothetical protein
MTDRSLLRRPPGGSFVAPVTQTIFSDDFHRANGPLGASWFVQGIPFSDIVVDANTMYCTGPQATGIATATLGFSDGNFSLEIKLADALPGLTDGEYVYGSDIGGIVAQADIHNNTGHSGDYIFEVFGRAGASDSVPIPDPMTGDTIKVVKDGTTVKGYYNGVLLLTLSGETVGVNGVSPNVQMPIGARVAYFAVQQSQFAVL